MIDGKRTSVPGSARISSLGDITMYTHNDDLPLRDILENMHKKLKGAEAPNHNSSTPQEIKDFVDSVVKELDHDRIYTSDLKKLVQWYNTLLAKNAFPFSEEEEGAATDDKARIWLSLYQILQQGLQAKSLQNQQQSHLRQQKQLRSKMNHITVIGAGTMGNGIAHVFAQKPSVVLIDRSEDALNRALYTIIKTLHA